MMLSGDGANQSVPGAANDKAANSAAVAVNGINIDQTPPAITTNSPYTPGVWTNQSVTVIFTCTDNLSGPALNNPVITGIPAMGSTLIYTQPNSLSSVATVTLTANTLVSGAKLNASCQDLAGNNAAPVAFGPILIDTTPPTVTATANLNSPVGPAYTAGLWTNQSVVVTFACSDALSGVKPGSITGNTSYGSQGSYTANGSCQDNAGNTGNGSFGPVLIDTTTPGVLIASPVAQTYVLNQTITPSFTCGDNSGGDTTTCTASPSASPYIAIAVGPATFSVHAVDQAGNGTNPDPSVSYLIVYNFTGFQSPLQSAVMLNPINPATPPQPADSGSFTVGTAIPIAWQMQDANNVYISDLTTITSIVAIPNPACAGTVPGPGTILYNASTGQAAFSYDNVNNRFVFNWDTTGTAAGCYNLVVTTNDTAQWSTIVHVVTPTISFSDFSNASSLLTLNNDSSLVSPDLRLTPDVQTQSGSAYFNSLQAVKNGFTTTFSYNITNPLNQGFYPADGFAFVIQNATAGLNALGGPGSSLGYGPVGNGSAGSIDNSLAIEFDTYQSDFDPNGNHIAVQSCGAGLGNSPAHEAPNSEGYPDCHLAINPSIASLLGQHTVTVTYNASAQTLSVQLDSSQAISLSSFNLANYINLAGTNSDSAYVGFTGATGGGVEQADILNWTYAPMP
jgi:hypothetical protein